MFRGKNLPVPFAVVGLLTVSAPDLTVCCYAQEVPQADSSQSARAIVIRSVSAWDQNDRLARNYVYTANNETREFDSAGRVKSVHSSVEEILFIGGKRYIHPVEKDGRRLPPPEAGREQAKLDRAAEEAGRLSDEERRKRLEELQAERSRERDRFKEIPDAYQFQLVREEPVNGRAAYEITATPRADYKGKYRGLLHNVQGKLWIDKQDYQWVRIEAEVLQTFSIGWFLARIGKGTQLSFEMARVNDEVWQPKHVSVTASARIGLVKKINAEQEITFSNYRRFQTDSRIISAGDPP
jgi:hypothetical protein